MKATGTNNIFQFHKGTIKTEEQWNPVSHRVNFNSIKVRLKLIR